MGEDGKVHVMIETFDHRMFEDTCEDAVQTQSLGFLQT